MKIVWHFAVVTFPKLTKDGEMGTNIGRIERETTFIVRKKVRKEGFPINGWSDVAPEHWTKTFKHPKDAEEKDHLHPFRITIYIV